MKVGELDGAELDYWVAKAEHQSVIVRNGRPVFEFDFDPERHAQEHVFGKIMKQYVWYQPSTDWGQGGPLIEKYNISSGLEHDGRWFAEIDGYPSDSSYSDGPSLLVAVCRSIVRYTFGSEVDAQKTYQQEKWK